MDLTPAQAASFAAVHESLVARMRSDGVVLDYSLASLKDLETIFAALRDLRHEDPSHFEAVAPRLWVTSGAYVAEVLRRAAPGARLQMLDDQVAVCIPSELVPGGRVKVLPLVRVAKLIREEETLHDWAVVFLAMADHVPFDAGGRGNA